MIKLYSVLGRCIFGDYQLEKGKNMLNLICYWLVVIGALNYGLIAFGFNFLEKLPANIGQIVSVAIAIAAIWTIFTKLKK